MKVKPFVWYPAEECFPASKNKDRTVNVLLLLDRNTVHMGYFMYGTGGGWHLIDIFNGVDRKIVGVKLWAYVDVED